MVEKGIVLGLPIIIVDAIENAVEVLFPMVEDSLHPAGRVLGQYLPGIGGTDGCQSIRVNHARFQKTHLTKKFPCLRTKVALGQVASSKVLPGKFP